MSSANYSITFACYNQLEYTKKCIQSIINAGTSLNNLVVVDNCSMDDTNSYLKNLELGGLITNHNNLGCGVAWNQGVLHQQKEWTVVMNNDVIVSPGWIENLIETAIKHNLKIISPSLIEGPVDYDFIEFAKKSSQIMKNSIRLGDCHAVCMAIHNSVWMEIGYFQPIPKLLGYEDTLFFHEADKAGIPIGMTGASWLHHFGSITQSAMKIEKGLSAKDGLGYRYNYKLLNQTWLERKLNKLNKKRKKSNWLKQELSKYSMSMHGLRKNNMFDWQ